MNDEKYTLAMVNNDQERDDVTKTDGDVNPRWVKMCKKKMPRRRST